VLQALAAVAEWVATADLVAAGEAASWADVAKDVPLAAVLTQPVDAPTTLHVGALTTPTVAAPTLIATIPAATLQAAVSPPIAMAADQPLVAAVLSLDNVDF